MDANLVDSSNDFSDLPRSWENFLGNGFDEMPDLGSLYSAPNVVLPVRQRVFRAFHSTPPEQVRVVLVGQDPYPSAGLADGLAFSQGGLPDKGSALHRLFLNLSRDPAISFKYPQNGDLTAWAAQGVLLMNAALTVELDAPQSHMGVWAGFSRAVLDRLNDPARRVAFILLGRDAIDLALPALTGVSPAAIIRAAHPVAGYTGCERSFSDARVFSEANKFLADDPIDWTLR